ncbi:hypothetical protein CDV31_013288 [Fusarium ambrosium]|uniref:Uncharacterized protein n=1 Tax=Fusarium ambrosium TaxID=131363 RepID=A0A428T468_9HYPO|nr:hypothetical protein CDV31_013288 [Fusarium ambrosium]
MWRPFYARGLLYSHSLTLVNAERLTYRPSETPSFSLPTRNQSGILNRYHPVREPADHTHKATVLALGYDAMMCWKCLLYYS